MSLDLVSLLMPTYNAGAYLALAIESVQAQTHKNWELVIVDDCSTDTTWGTALNFAEYDTRIKVFRNSTTLGIPKNRKRTYEASTGDYVAHFDQDDLLERWAIEEMLREFERTKVSMLYSDRLHIDEKGVFMNYASERSFDQSQSYTYAHRHFCMFRRNVMDYIEGYNDKLVSACEDSDIFAQIADKFPTAHLPKVLYAHRSHPNNAQKLGHVKSCGTCTERVVCNHIRIWAAGHKINHITMEPL